MKKAKKKSKKEKDLCRLYFFLPRIISEHPDLRQEAFDIWEKAIESPNNTRYSIEDTFSSLREVVRKDNSTVPQVWSICKIALASDKNDAITLNYAKDALYAVVEANPDLAKEAHGAFVKALDRYEDQITPKTRAQKVWRKFSDINMEDKLNIPRIKQMREDAVGLLDPKGKDKGCCKTLKELEVEFPQKLQTIGIGTVSFKERFCSVNKAAGEAFLLPYKLTRDVIKGIRLSKGNFKELTGLLAQRIAANLETMGVLGECKYKDISVKIKEKTGANEVPASDFAKAHGKVLSNMRSTLPPMKRIRETR